MKVEREYQTYREMAMEKCLPVEYQINSNYQDSELATRILQDPTWSEPQVIPDILTYEEFLSKFSQLYLKSDAPRYQAYGTSSKNLSLFEDEITDDDTMLSWLANWISKLNILLKTRPKFQSLFINNQVNCRKAIELNSIRTNMTVISNMETTKVLECVSHFQEIRGATYASLSFSERYEVLKEVTNTFLVTDVGLESVHRWLCDDHKCSTEADRNEIDGEEFRIRSVKLELYNQDNIFETMSENALVVPDNDHMRIIVKLSSSPKDKYLKSRYRLKFGANSTIGVQFSFPRMGKRTQLYYKNNPNLIKNSKETDVYPKLVDSFVTSQSNQTELSEAMQQLLSDNTKIERILNEKQGYAAMKSVLNKPLWIAGCKFEQLCQNTSGMHSYKYSYYSEHLSTFPKFGIEKVKEWAIPLLLNPELYEPEQHLKYVLRLSLLNTPVIPTITITEYTIIEDIVGEEGNFTDGCGFISIELAREITDIIKQQDKNIKSPQSDSQRYQPNHNTGYDDSATGHSDIISAFQIRYNGAKGMLLVNPNVQGLVLRKSMIKFIQVDSDSSHTNIHVVGYSSPASSANINPTIMHLLSGCSKNQKLEDRILQLWHQHVETTLEEYFQENLLKKLISDGDYKGLNVLGMTKDRDLSFLAGPFRAKLLQLKLPVVNARRLYGVADPFGVLKKDEVYVNVTIGSDSRVLEQDIVITKEPCLHRGDLRKLKSVRKKELEYLRDVIVFPVVGKRPIPNMITGSDLDGDKYFVCWDSDMVDNLKQFEPGIFDVEMESNQSKDFDPDVFKNWVGIRHAYACYFGSSWTSDENWKIMERLSEIVNLAVDAPKKGKTFQAFSEQDVEIIKNFPGYPHYHPEKNHTSVRHSTSLIGKMFDYMIDKITSKMNFVRNNSEFLITSLDDREYITISNLFHMCTGNTKAYLETNKMMNFLKDHLDSIQKRKETIQFTSEFLNIYWRTLCFLSYKYKYVYLWNLSQATENVCLSESILNSLSLVIQDKESCLLTVQGLLNSRITCKHELIENSLIKIELNRDSFRFILSLFYNACSRLQLDLGFNLLDRAKSFSKIVEKRDFPFRHRPSLKTAITCAFSDKDNSEKYIMWLLYKNGHKFPLDLEMALTWLIRSGRVLAAKEGVLNFSNTKTNTSLRNYLQKKARRGYAESQYNLGRLYYLIDKNVRQALYWLKKSAEQYLFEAGPDFILSSLLKETPDQNGAMSVSVMYQLAQMFENGSDKNSIMACYWYERCAYVGIRSCENCQVCKGEYYEVESDSFKIDQLLDQPLPILDQSIIEDNEEIESPTFNGPFSGSCIVNNQIGQQILKDHDEKCWNLVYKAGETDSLKDLRKTLTKLRLTFADIEIFLFFKTNEGEVFGFFTNTNWTIESLRYYVAYTSKSKIYKIEEDQVHVFPRDVNHRPSPIPRFGSDFLDAIDIRITSGFLLLHSTIDLGHGYIVPEQFRTTKKILIDELEIFVSSETIANPQKNRTIRTNLKQLR